MMTSTFITRPPLLLGVVAAVLAIVSAVAASASAADTDAIRAKQSSHIPPRGGQFLRSAPIQAALNLLRWSRAEIPAIEVVELRPPHVHILVNGWVVYNVDGTARPTIYVAGWTELYRAALRNPRNPQNIIRLAGVLAHEQAHIRHGPDEETAYAEQLTTLERLHAHQIELTEVRRALQAVRRKAQGR